MLLKEFSIYIASLKNEFKIGKVVDALGAEARLRCRERSFSFGVGSLCRDGLREPDSQTRPALSGEPLS